jgi:pimeloyl-ACP methyl ester carboxylesterase
MRDDHPLPGTDHVVDGVRLHVVHHGSGDGLPLLLLHGVPTSSYLWRDVQRDLEHCGSRTYAPDLLGLGCSERPAAARYDLASQASLMLALADSLGLSRFAVAGHDVGGGVAVHLAALAPERVAALVLVDAPVHSDVWPVPSVRALAAPYVGDMQGMLLRLGGGRPMLARTFTRGLRATELSPRALDHYAAPLLSPDGIRGLLALIRSFDPAAVQSAFDLMRAEAPPTLVLWGDGDVWLSPAVGRRVAGDVPGASYVEVTDAGHFLPEDRPERVAEEIAGFLAEVGQTAPA